MKQGGIDAVHQYLLAQHEKGLLFLLQRYGDAPGGTLLCYETYESTHREILLPEVQRLVDTNKIKLELSTNKIYPELGNYIYAAVLLL